MTQAFKPQSDVGLIVAAAGTSQRFGNNRNKLLEPLDGIPVFCHCLRNFAPLILPELTVLVISETHQAQFEDALCQLNLPTGCPRIVSGADSRQESVLKGLQALPEAARFVAVADGARPYSTAHLLALCLKSARHRGSGVAARRITDTIKMATADGRVISTPQRSRLWATETPQVFQRKTLQKAYERVLAEDIEVTDEAQAVELLGEPVFLVEHNDLNRKITFQNDLPEKHP